MDDMDEIVQEFLVESHENLDQLDHDLVELEQDPTSRPLLSSIFRTIHTIKGTSGFLAFNQLESITHVGESLLSRLRDGALTLTPDMTSALLSMVDSVRALLQEIERSGTEGSSDHTDLIASLTALQNPTAAATRPSAAEAPAKATTTKTTTATTTTATTTTAKTAATKAKATTKAKAGKATPVDSPGSAAGEAADGTTGPARAGTAPTAQAAQTAPTAPTAPTAQTAPTAPTDSAPTDAPVTEAAPTATEPDAPAPAHGPGALLGEVLVDQGSATEDDVTFALAAQEVGDDRRIGEILVTTSSTTPEAVATALDVQHEGRRSAADSTIRVDVDLLDTLMNLVGELVLTRNQIVQRAASRQDPELLRTSHRLNLIAGELQEGVMRTRMQPIDTVWSKLPRVVRDLSVQLHKQVRVQMEGRDTDLDKTILESVKDPLTHLVRNAVDHGIETPAARLAAGKPAEGTLTLRAFHEGGQVNIEICDDGAGIDPQRLRDRAVSRGILTPEAAARTSDREAYNLIFAPGFSTAEKVTNVSGRGVGMDVVKTNIEKIGGLVDVQSVLGVGTTIRIKIPLTLAIIPALVVRAGTNRYAVPQVNLLELLRLEVGGSGPQTETVQGTPVFRLRGQLLPLVSLREQLNLAPSESGTTYIVVLQADDRQFGLVVDDIQDTEEIVVKPLGGSLRHIDLYAGATIMGDGEISLILDTMALAQQAGVLTENARQQQAASDDVSDGTDRAQLLLMSLTDGRRLGLNLDMVDRLEEVPPSRVERIGTHEVVQYRESLLPLVRLDEVYQVPGGRVPVPRQGGDGLAAEDLQVVVSRHRGCLIGLVVNEILDIVDAELTVRSALDSGGRYGSVVVNGRVTEVVDVAHAVSGLDEAVFTETSQIASFVVPQALEV